MKLKPYLYQYPRQEKYNPYSKGREFILHETRWFCKTKRISESLICIYYACFERPSLEALCSACHAENQKAIYPLNH